MAEPYPKAGFFLKSSCCVSVTWRISTVEKLLGFIIALFFIFPGRRSEETSEQLMALHCVLTELGVIKFEGVCVDNDLKIFFSSA